MLNSSILAVGEFADQQLSALLDDFSHGERYSVIKPIFTFRLEMLQNDRRTYETIEDIRFADYQQKFKLEDKEVEISEIIAENPQVMEIFKELGIVLFVTKI
jgi:hypothetical protein